MKMELKYISSSISCKTSDGSRPKAVVTFHHTFRQVVNVKLLAVHQLEHSVCLCTVRSAGVEGKSSGDPDQGTGIIMATPSSNESLKNVSSS